MYSLRCFDSEVEKGKGMSSRELKGSLPFCVEVFHCGVDGETAEDECCRGGVQRKSPDRTCARSLKMLDQSILADSS